jgi:hypothetical protein
VATQMTPSKIPFSSSNVMRCMCPKCPVQANSVCIKSKIALLKEALTIDPIRPEDIPGMYCATGIAFCNDTDFSKMCSCPDCPIYIDYQLIKGTPKKYYCRDGASNSLHMGVELGIGRKNLFS